jgi:hypothetical protein
VTLAMAEAPTPENIAADMTVPERILLFCVASNTDWIRAGIRAVTTRALLVKGLIERDHVATYRLTDQGRAVLSALLARSAV